MSNTIAIFSSARRNGNTGTFLDQLAKQITMDIVDLAELNISEYDYQHRNIDDDFIPTMKKITQYEHIIFACPVYWYAVTPQMKIFLDRLSDLLDLEELKNLGRLLRSKQCYVLSTSISQNIAPSFIGCLTATFDYLGMNYKGYSHLDCDLGYNQAAADKEIANFVALFKSAHKNN